MIKVTAQARFPLSPILRFQSFKMMVMDLLVVTESGGGDNNTNPNRLSLLDDKTRSTRRVVPVPNVC